MFYFYMNRRNASQSPSRVLKDLEDLDPEEIVQDIRLMVVSESSKIEGDGIGIFWLYMIFVIGTLASSYLISKLDDEKIFEDIERKEKQLEDAQRDKEIELEDLTNKP